MKLSKEVCKRCNKRARADWDEWDDLEWDNGIVFCPWVGWISVNSWPHKNCRFAVEHIALCVASQGQEAMEGPR